MKKAIVILAGLSLMTSSAFASAAATALAREAAVPGVTATATVPGLTSIVPGSAAAARAAGTSIVTGVTSGAAADFSAAAARAASRAASRTATRHPSVPADTTIPGTRPGPISMHSGGLTAPRAGGTWVGTPAAVTSNETSQALRAARAAQRGQTTASVVGGAAPAVVTSLARPAAPVVSAPASQNTQCVAGIDGMPQNLFNAGLSSGLIKQDCSADYSLIKELAADPVKYSVAIQHLNEMIERSVGFLKAAGVSNIGQLNLGDMGRLVDSLASVFGSANGKENIKMLVEKGCIGSADNLGKVI